MTLKIESLPIDKLKFDPTNARKHSNVNLSAIAESLKQFGQRKPIVITTENVIVAGNGTVEAARLLGLTDVDVVRVPKDWSADQVKAFALADNRTAELAEWNPEVLSAQLLELGEAGFNVEALGFEVTVVKSLADVVEDDVPDVPGEAVTQPGDVWVLGNHRLICGDSTREETYDLLLGGELADLIVTDPPYGVNYEGGQNKKKREKLASDDVDIFTEAMPWLFTYSHPHAALYLWYASGKGHYAYNAVRSNGYEVRAQIVWHKLKAHYGAFMSQYMPKHEPSLYCFKSGQSAQWFGPTNEVTVWEYDQPSRNEHHPTEKPVTLFARAISNSSKPGDIVLDAFGGSGTLIMACEQLDRSARVIELDPKYCDVIVKRWESVTKKKAVLDNASR
jgi:site-specific DNA-methyltransferase (adenine-specific)